MNDYRSEEADEEAGPQLIRSSQGHFPVMASFDPKYAAVTHGIDIDSYSQDQKDYPFPT